MKLIQLLFLIIIFFSCKALPYEDDTNLKSSGESNSFEFPVKVNGVLCKDMKGKVGYCALNISENRPISFVIPKREYSYRLHINCSSDIEDSTFDVLKNKEFKYSINDFKNLDQFQCVGKVFPIDRPGVNAKFGIFIKLIDSDYIKREEIYEGQGYIILGKHSLFANVGKKLKTKKTYVKDKGKSIFTESLNMRFNYWRL